VKIGAKSIDLHGLRVHLLELCGLLFGGVETRALRLSELLILIMSKKYIITGYNTIIYCFIDEIDNAKCKYLILFKDTYSNFRLAADIDSLTANIIYFNNRACYNIDNFIEYEKDVVIFIRIAFFAIKILFRYITKIHIADFLQILYNGTNEPFKLSLSYDYILKYNQTWYQNKFGAELPEYADKDYINSLLVLDEPIMDYSLIIDLYPQFIEYEYEYRISKTPREFINTLRLKLQSEFYFKVGPWLNQYMKTLQIKLSSEFWYIATSSIAPIDNFSIKLMNKELGEFTDNTNECTGFHIASDSNFTNSYIGTYEQFE
jgi:hypothetical protein